MLYFIFQKQQQRRRQQEILSYGILRCSICNVSEIQKNHVLRHVMLNDITLAEHLLQ